MILHLGKNTVIRDNDIIGLFDMDTATTKEDTKRFIRKMEKEKKINIIDEDVPKSFIVEKNEKLHLSIISTNTLKKRLEKKREKR
jgi:hypothetical protein